MTGTPHPTPPLDIPAKSARKGPNWPRRGMGAAAIAGLLLVVSITSGSGDDQVDRLETLEENAGAHDTERHTRPSGDPSTRPAAIDEHVVTVAPALDDETATTSQDRTPDTTVGSAVSPDLSGQQASGPTVIDPPATPPQFGSSGPRPGTPIIASPSPSTGPQPTPQPGDEQPAPPVPDLAPPVVPDVPVPDDDPIADLAPVRFADPPPDQVRCPSIDLHAIGDLPDDADAEMIALAPRFRAMAAAELARDELVCANPIERWRGIVIQRLFVAGQPDGVITAHDATHELVRFSDPEWRGYRLLPDYIDLNLSGDPIRRDHHGDHTIVRTTRGGLVSRRSDTHGFLVVNGAWTMWADQNGRATMGFPETQPALSTTLGIYQDFAHGWLQIPGVFDPFVAEGLGPEAYVWHPVPNPQADVPADALGNILEVNQTSWFIDRDGVRHWIPDTREFNCARSEQGARKITVRGWAVATFPIGEPYTCATD